MKFAEGIYPKGTFSGQKTDGAYISETLANNLDIYAKKIVKDMHFLLIISGNDGVGNGKTTLATHQGAYLTNKINEMHGLNNTFTHSNMVFSAKGLVERSFELPQYSVIVLDEGDDLTTHGMKQAAVELKRYFRKCRQLNQTLILILPSFFELPKFYALARSHALCNVKFLGEFERGFFDFYGPRSKKTLYLKGKKEWDYDCCKKDFDGRFFGSYTFFPNPTEETELYKADKYNDMMDDHEDKKQKTEKEVIKETTRRLFKQILRNLPDLTSRKLCIGFGVSERTVSRWLNDYNEEIPREIE